MRARFPELIAGVLLLGGWLGGCQCGGAPSDETAAPARPRPPLVVSVVGEPVTFNPIIANDPTSRAVGGAVFDTLLRLDPSSGRVIPNLASSWTVDDARTEYTLTLRDDVPWQDGEPFTAADVAFTVDAIHASEESPYAGILRVDDTAIRAVQTGPHTVRFRLPRPYAPFLQSLVIPILPAHRLGDRDPEADVAVADRWDVSTDPDEIVGTGPFRLKEYAPGERLLLARNPTYWRSGEEGTPLPRLDRYVLRIASDRDQARAWFLDGAIHIFSPRFDEVGSLLRAAAESGFEVRAVGPDTGSLFLTFNRNPLHYRRSGKVDPRLRWFTDRSFLLAVAHSIDKRAIIDRALDGHGEPALSHVPPANRFYDSELTDYVYDPAVARRILEDGGYLDRDGDGVREDSAGNPLSFILSTNDGNPVRERIARLIIAQLADVGIRASLETLSFPALFERLDATYDWDAMLLGFTGGIDPASSENLLRSSGSLHVWHPSQPEPATAWEAEIDRLLDRGTREMDPAKRKEIYWHVQEILHEELPMIHIVRPNLFTAYSDQVLHFRPSPWGFQRIEEIDLRESTPPAPPHTRRARRRGRTGTTLESEAASQAAK